MSRTSPGMIIVIIAMLLLTGGTYWLLQANKVQLTDFNQITKAHIPDYTTEQLSVTQLNKLGQAEYQFNASKLVHYEDDQSSLLDMPAVRIFQANSAPVTITADKGAANSDASMIDLYENAKIFRPAFENDPFMQAQSQHFRIYPNDDVIETHQPVQLKRGLSIVTADGMKYNNVTRFVQLFGHVRGTIDSQR